MCAKHNHKYRIKLGKLTYVCPSCFLLVLKYVLVVLPWYQKNAVFNQNLIFFTNHFTVRYSKTQGNSWCGSPFSLHQCSPIPLSSPSKP